MSEDLHPVQVEMLRLEERFDLLGNPPIDECMKLLSGFEGDVNTELDPLLQAEAQRAVTLAKSYYGRAVGQALRPTEIAAIGFMQGIMFAAAVRGLRDAKLEAMVVNPPLGIATKRSTDGHIDVGMVYPFDALVQAGCEPLRAEGDVVAKADYPELYAVLTNAFPGLYDADGDTFQLPDLRGKVIVEGDPE